MSKKVYKRIRGETSEGWGGGGKSLPVYNFVEYPPGIIHT